MQCESCGRKEAISKQERTWGWKTELKAGGARKGTKARATHFSRIVSDQGAGVLKRFPKNGLIWSSQQGKGEKQTPSQGGSQY